MPPALEAQNLNHWTAREVPPAPWTLVQAYGMLALIQNALTDTPCMVFATWSRSPMARCLCKVQDLGPERLVEVIGVVKP